MKKYDFDFKISVVEANNVKRERLKRSKAN